MQSGGRVSCFVQIKKKKMKVDMCLKISSCNKLNLKQRPLQTCLGSSYEVNAIRSQILISTLLLCFSLEFFNTNKNTSALQVAAGAGLFSLTGFVQSRFMAFTLSFIFLTSSSHPFIVFGLSLKINGPSCTLLCMLPQKQWLQDSSRAVAIITEQALVTMITGTTMMQQLGQRLEGVPL